MKLIASSLVVISAVLLIALPQFFWAIFFARFIAGIGHGLAYVIAVQYFGEICDAQIRGQVGATMHLFLLKGGIISGVFVINFFSVEGRMDPNRFLGIASLCLSCIAIYMTLRFHKESIVTLIESGRDAEAIQTMILMRGQAKETTEIRENFNELKMMIAEDKHNKSGIFAKENLRPLLTVVFLRIAFVCSFNYALKYAHNYMTHNSNSINYTFVLNFIHTLTVFVVRFTIDSGRRKHFLLSSCGTSVVMIIFGSLRISAYANAEFLVFIMFVLIELFSAIGLGLLTHIYSTEAFTTARKSASIAFTSTIEFILQILFIFWVDKKIYFYSFDVTLLSTCGLILMIISIYLFFNLPETKSVSIRKTRSKFLK